MPLSFTISNAPWDFDYGIYLRLVTSGIDGERSVGYGQPIQVETRKASDESLFENPQPILRCRKEELQQLMDELWRAGLRPSEGSGSAGAMLATQRHLEDMRTLVFETKPVAKASF